MKIGFVGLGKMGSNMVERLLRNGHEVVAYDPNPSASKEGAGNEPHRVGSVAELVENLPEQRIVWLMVPEGNPVKENIEELSKVLKAGDTIVDGGNSNWRNAKTHALELEKKGIDFIDCGTSGGIWGLENGYCLMVGGDQTACKKLEPIFCALAQENGFLYCGPSGAGHFVKMVHNGIEYGMMQAYAEGFEVMEKSSFNLDMHGISKVWQKGSVVRSWLLELAESLFEEDPKLSKIKDHVEDSGEGRWMVQTAIDLNVPAPVITLSLLSRLRSRQPESFGMKVLAGLRNRFGGHGFKTK
ncbi:MAG: decarboxylating 6-phosphogluconate dehydrogenase [Nitrospina sp.]|jgi:6-phosphogluconate dehydrogenase|nr:decarboxylating 6-phosphogluconate dehydrogenase [Nitrospina sp.]